MLGSYQREREEYKCTGYVESLEDMAFEKGPSKLRASENKERKKFLIRGHVEDIGSTVGIQSYRGQGYEEAMSGNCFANFRHLHLYVMDVFSGARVVRVL